MSKGILSGTASSGFAAGADCAAGGCCATDRAVTKRARPRTDRADMVASPVRDESLRLRRRRRCAPMLACGTGLPRERVMKTSMGVTVFSVCLFAAACVAAPPVNPGGPGHLPPPAPTGFDNASNGLTDDATHQVDQGQFDEFEEISDGLGPLYN